MGTSHLTRRRVSVAVTAFGMAVACAGPERTTGAGTTPRTVTTAHLEADNPNSAAGDEKRIIHGWLDGETVPLR